jgi:hypothetical protein
MKHLRSINHLILISLALLGLSVSSVNAAIVSVTPDSTILNVGDSLTVDVGITGLALGGVPSLGAFVIDFHFDGSLFALGAVTFGDQLQFFGEPSVQTVTPGPGILNVSEFSSFDDAFMLDIYQSDGFLLFSAEFVALSVGTDVFALPFIDLLLTEGFSDQFPVNSSAVQVLSPGAVPVPAAISLFGTALIGFVGMSRRTKVA